LVLIIFRIFKTAIKGIVVSDKASGESIACIDARENDNNDNPRIIQQFSEITSPASGIQGIETGTPLRTLDFGTSSPKGGAGEGDDYKLNSTEISSDITSNLLDVSDASVFVLYFTLDFSATSNYNVFIQCVPLAFIDDGSEVAFCFNPALIRVPYSVFADTSLSNPFVIEDDLDTYDSVRTYQDETNSKYVSVPLVYPTYGVKKVGVSLRAHSFTYLIADIFGYTLSGAAADAALSNAVHHGRILTTSSIPTDGSIV